MAEIEKEDFNLNISRYIGTAVAEDEIDLAQTHATLTPLDGKIREVTARPDALRQEPAPPPLPGAKSK